MLKLADAHGQPELSETGAATRAAHLRTVLPAHEVVHTHLVITSCVLVAQQNGDETMVGFGSCWDAHAEHRPCGHMWPSADIRRATSVVATSVVATTFGRQCQAELSCALVRGNARMYAHALTNVVWASGGAFQAGYDVPIWPLLRGRCV